MIFSLFKPAANQRGVSLVEGLIGLGAIAGIAAVIATISTNTNDRGFIYRRACESMANNAIDALTDEALFMNVVHFTPSAGKDTITAAEGAGLFTIAEIANGDLWTGTTKIIDDGARPIVRNEVLIQGAMRALNALYNHSTLDFCAGYQEYAPMSIASLGIQNELTRSNQTVPPILRLRLGATNLSTGVSGCPARPFSIVPRSGLGPAQQGFEATSYDSRDGANDGLARRGAELSPNHKYVLTAQVEYNHDGQVYTCEVSKDFQYSTDGTAPNLSAANVAVSIVENNSRQATFLDYACIPLAADRQATVVIQVGNIEAGSLLLCRDISQTQQYADTTSVNEIPNAPHCATGDGSTFNGRRNPRPNLTRNTFQEVPAAEDKWYPCDEARICGGVSAVDPHLVSGNSGVAPSASVVLGAGTPPELTQIGSPITISLTYNNLPPNCIVGLQVAAVDIAGNVSGVFTNETSFPASPQAQYISDPLSPTASPLFDATVTFAAGLGANHDKRVIAPPWCGATATPDYGTPDQWGVLCLPAPDGEVVPVSAGGMYPRTPNWHTTVEGGDSTNTVGNTPAHPSINITGFTANSDWRDEFPNGYYTCRPQGCCFSNLPNVCTPWSN